MEALFAGLKLADIHDDLFRNIVSVRVSEDLYEDLSATPADWKAAAALEFASRPPPFASSLPVIHRPFEEATWNAAIAYPFPNWMRSRYSDGSFGVWYEADTVDATVFETAHHWRHGLLEDADFMRPGVSMERKVYRARCDAALLDLRPAIEEVPSLIDPADYSLTQQVGARLHREGHPGLISHSARGPGDTYAVLNAAVLSNPSPHCSLTYTTTDTGVRVERSPGTTWMTIRQ